MDASGSAMGLSVIVTSYDGVEPLLRCLTALVAQAEVRQVIVADASPSDPAPLVGIRFPSVRVLHDSALTSVPALRWSALPFASEPIVAALESRVVPEGDWAREILHAHAAGPQFPAIGGTVSCPDCASLFAWGLYFSEYAAFAPPAGPQPVHDISGANLSYKRSLLVEAEDRMTRGDWETKIHADWVKAGSVLGLCRANVVFYNAMTRRQALHQRFAYGRGYAAERFSGGRLSYAILAPLLAVALTMRAARHAGRKGLFRRFVPALPWTFSLNLFWALGEAIGYATGRRGNQQLI